jgi:hypothetical protein
MANKILMAFVVADLLFLITGAMQLGFSLVVQNVMSEVPTEGQQAARNLLYQRFPLQGSWNTPISRLVNRQKRL